MKIHSVFDSEFTAYGTVAEGYDTVALVAEMEKIAMPEVGTEYLPSIKELEACAVFSDFETRGFGALPAQLGLCWGYNTRLNCLEYHRSSEFNVGTDDFILLLAHQDEIRDGVVDSSCVKAFRVPAGVVVEVYATTLHYAPCQVGSKGFRVAVVLPAGTNTGLPTVVRKCGEDRRLTARNKWLLPHPDSKPAQNGVPVGICGANIDVAEYLR